MNRRAAWRPGSHDPFLISDKPGDNGIRQRQTERPCSFTAGKVGEVAACGCLWWHVGQRGRWYAISKRRAFRMLVRDLGGELTYLEVTGNWPAG